MLLRIVSAGWHGDVERAVERSVSTIDRVREHYQALDGPDAKQGDGDTVVMVASAGDSLPDVIRRVTEAMLQARARMARVTAA